jgi:hypothetical protein
VIVSLDVSRLRRGFRAPPDPPGRHLGRLGEQCSLAPGLKSGLEGPARWATFVSEGPQSRCRKSDRTAIFLDFSVLWWNFFVSIGEYLGLHECAVDLGPG